MSRQAREQGVNVIIAAAGLAAHLPGVVAAYTTLPVIGVPINTGALSGQDALYSIAQMPPGVPVATVAIDGGKNAALLAAQIIGSHNSNIAAKLQELKSEMKEKVREKQAKLEEKMRRIYR